MRYLYPITIILIVVVLALIMRFLYHNVYQTIIEAELITDLRKEVSDEVLKEKSFKQVIDNIDKKSRNDALNIETIKNPFRSLQ